MGDQLTSAGSIRPYRDIGAPAGKPSAWEDARLAYRQQMLHGLIFWTYTLLVGKGSQPQPEK